MIVVQCEFDGTVTAVDLGFGLREAFGPDGWADMEEDFLAGRCSAEENIAKQFKLIKASKQEIEDFVLGNVVLRPEFNEFVEYCRGVGLKLVIVSTGLDIWQGLFILLAIFLWWRWAEWATKMKKLELKASSDATT